MYNEIFPYLKDDNEITDLMEHISYVRENDLQWVIDTLSAHSIEHPVDEVFDYEFVVKTHQLGSDFPNDPDLIIGMFILWLKINYHHSTERLN